MQKALRYHSLGKYSEGKKTAWELRMVVYMFFEVLPCQLWKSKHAWSSKQWREIRMQQSQLSSEHRSLIWRSVHFRDHFQLFFFSVSPLWRVVWASTTSHPILLSVSNYFHFYRFCAHQEAPCNLRPFAVPYSVSHLVKLSSLLCELPCGPLSL